MEFDNFLGEPRWQILELIAKEPTSPVKISEEIKTSVAYVSQQLKLLEAAGIVKKVRTKEFTKGKPRLIYSISKDIFHITALINKTPKKKKISPTSTQKITLRLWFLENKELRETTERLFWKIENSLESIEGIFIDEKGEKIIIISKKESIKTTATTFLKNSKIKFELFPDFKKIDANSLYEIYKRVEDEK